MRVSSPFLVRADFREPHVPTNAAPSPQAPKYVYDFTEGNKDLKDLLGGKGANLAEMTNLGLPVPPGFTITTEACRAYLAQRHRARRRCATQVTEHLRRARGADGPQARRRRRPAAGLGALRARSSRCPG